MYYVIIKKLNKKHNNLRFIFIFIFICFYFIFNYLFDIPRVFRTATM